ALELSGNIIGNIALTNANTGMVTLSGNNTFTGGVYVVAGTLRVNNSAALGGVMTNGQPNAIVTNGATLDVGAPALAANGLNMGQRSVVVYGNGVGGRGVIVNIASNQ